MSVATFGTLAAAVLLAGCSAAATPEAGDADRAQAYARVFDQQVCWTGFDNGVETALTTPTCTVDPPIRVAPGLWRVKLIDETTVCFLIDLDRFTERDNGSLTGYMVTRCP